ncbi:MAG: GNAT family N-acetyltransferase [Candidatus Abyssobacteria bacterium SURF_17]|jgi:ribosomal protein S18 acetylase RimI-like enzyme|uniref:GNAT family N-acetyltransferase n=1 Tax=Candidatus Abyssobacteria bacterium SURF_17 TaxID=2093361 RepID=A0A419ENF2_9BACT|nr:MAG: GNAT family N-acetyltransferase [Candidatus Abyssubacteria bacterium SURF_17]
MATHLRELVLNEARAFAVFANGRLHDHRFAVSLVCEELLDNRYNRAHVIEPANLTGESLEEISRDFHSVRVPLRLDLFLPIPPETQSLLERRQFDLTEDHASEMVLGKSATELRRNRAVRLERLPPHLVNTFSTLMLKAYDTPPDLIPTLASTFRHTIPRALNHKGVILYLASLESEPVGTLYVFSQGGVGGVYNLAVALHARRQGVATTLMLQAIEDSLTAGNHTLCLQTRVGSFQERFFERLGFHTIARRKRAVRRHA